jgi:DNA-binding transcriptional LysR family regulator
MKDINLNFIRCFKELSETLSFSTASQKMGLAQSNVSRQIKLLEDSLETQLFQRTRHQVSLTREGLQFKQEILPLAQELEEKLNHFIEGHNRLRGSIKLGSYSEVGKIIFAPLCFEFQKLHPELEIEISYQNENSILDEVQSGKSEFGILSHPPILEGISAFPIYKQKIILVCHPDHLNLNKASIENLNFVAFEKNDALLSELWSKHISKRSKPNIVIYVNSHQSMLEAVMSNKLAAVLPAMSVEKELSQSKIQKVDGYEFEIPLYLIFAQNNWMAKKNLEFKSFLLKKSKELKN